MLGGAREGPSMDAAFEEYLKTADLTQYEKINRTHGRFLLILKTLVYQ